MSQVLSSRVLNKSQVNFLNKSSIKPGKYIESSINIFKEVKSGKLSIQSSKK